MEPSLPLSQPLLNPLASLRDLEGDAGGESTDPMAVAPPLGVFLPSKAAAPARTALFLKLENP